MKTDELIAWLRNAGAQAGQRLESVTYFGLAADRLEELARRLAELTRGMDCPGSSDSSREWVGDPAKWLVPPNTVRVRVAVCIDEKGYWCIGHDYASKYILVADLPIPTISEVPARVEEVE